MYFFKAHYTNMDDETEVTKIVKIDGQFFGTEKECYMYAMGKAYDMAEKNESFDSIELLAC